MNQALTKHINIEISKESMSTKKERLCNKNPSFLIFSKIFFPAVSFPSTVFEKLPVNKWALMQFRTSWTLILTQTLSLCMEPHAERCETAIAPTNGPWDRSLGYRKNKTP